MNLLASGKKLSLYSLIVHVHVCVTLRLVATTFSGRSRRWCYIRKKNSNGRIVCITVVKNGKKCGIGAGVKSSRKFILRYSCAFEGRPQSSGGLLYALAINQTILGIPTGTAPP